MNYYNYSDRGLGIRIVNGQVINRTDNVRLDCLVILLRDYFVRIVGVSIFHRATRPVREDRP